MSFISQPAANLHSPGPIGDVTPNTIAVTTSTLGGNVSFSQDATYNIGAAASGRPNNVYVAGEFRASGAICVSTINDLANTVNIFSITNGSASITFAPGDTTPMMRWSGATAAAVGIKRVSTTLQARLADDSGFAPFQGKLTTDTNATTGLGAGLLAATTNATVTVFDASGQAYRVPCII